MCWRRACGERQDTCRTLRCAAVGPGGTQLLSAAFCDERFLSHARFELPEFEMLAILGAHDSPWALASILQQQQTTHVQSVMTGIREHSTAAADHSLAVGAVASRCGYSAFYGTAERATAAAAAMDEFSCLHVR